MKASANTRSLKCAEAFVWEARTPTNDAMAIFGEKAEMAHPQEGLCDL